MAVRVQKGNFHKAAALSEMRLTSIPLENAVDLTSERSGSSRGFHATCGSHTCARPRGKEGRKEPARRRRKGVWVIKQLLLSAQT